MRARFTLLATLSVAALVVVFWLGQRPAAAPSQDLPSVEETFDPSATPVVASSLSPPSQGRTEDPAFRSLPAQGDVFWRDRTLLCVTQRRDHNAGPAAPAANGLLELQLARGSGPNAGQWRGRPVRWTDELATLIAAELELNPDPALDLVFEVDPAAPRDIDLACAVVFESDLGTTRIRWRATERLQLPQGRRVIHHPARFDVATPWVSGVVVPSASIDLEGARVELCILPEASRHDVELEFTAPFVVHASAPVTEARTFVIPPPVDVSPARGRLRVVLPDGRVHVDRRVCWKFAQHYALNLPQDTSGGRALEGRLVYQGRAAAGLATVSAERRGSQVGAGEVGPDGRFTLTGLPAERGDIELVVSSAPPRLELCRRPLPTDGTDFGDIELEPLGTALELQLVNAAGDATTATLLWRSRFGSGRSQLGVAESHTILLPKNTDVALTLQRGGWSEALVVRPGLQRIFVP